MTLRNPGIRNPHEPMNPWPLTPRREPLEAIEDAGDCQVCGEGLTVGGGVAEIFKPNTGAKLFTCHPCAADLLQRGWELA